MAVRWFWSAVSSWVKRSLFWVSRSVSCGSGLVGIFGGGVEVEEGESLKEAREALIKEGVKSGEERARSKEVGGEVEIGERSWAVNV